MADSTSPLQSFVPLPPESENKIKKTFKLFKDSWRALSRGQKSQLVIVLALVLGLPAILGGVYTVKLFAPRAETPITSPVSPPTTPTPSPQPTTIPDPNPVILNASLPVGYKGKFYQVSISANISNLKTQVTLSATGFPTMIKQNDCYVSGGTSGTTTRTFSCTYSGTPATVGTYSIKITAKASTGVVVTKNLPLQILKP